MKNTIKKEQYLLEIEHMVGIMCKDDSLNYTFGINAETNSAFKRLKLAFISKVSNKSAVNSYIRFKKFPLLPGKNYELIFDYSQDPLESKQHDSLLLLRFDFYNEDKKINNLVNVLGLKTGTSGILFRNIPSTYYVAKKGTKQTEATFRMTFKVPKVANKIQITMQNFKNSKKLYIGNPVMYPVMYSAPQDAPETDSISETAVDYFSEFKNYFDGDKAIELNKETPFWVSNRVMPFYKYEIRGSLNVQIGEATKRALMRIAFFDHKDNLIEGPHSGIAQSESVGPYSYLPTNKQGKNYYEISFTAPPGAFSVNLGFQGWYNKYSIRLNSDLRIITKPLNIENILKTINMWDEWNMSQEGLSGEQLSISFLYRIYGLFCEKLDTDITLGELINYYTYDKSNKSVFIEPATKTSYGIDDSGKVYIKNNHTIDNSGKLGLSGFEFFVLPDEPTWKEDPFYSTSWRQIYQALDWLLVFLTQTNGINKIEKYLNSWVSSNTWPRKVDPYAYDDHTIAKRAEFLISLLKIYPSITVDKPGFSAKIISLLLVHGFLLDELLDNIAFYSHNHRLFHAHGLLSIALTLPGAPFASYWKQKSLFRIEQLADELYTNDGFSAEQASSYQFITTRILINLYLSFRKTTILPDKFMEKIMEKINKSFYTSILQTHPDGSLIRMGDSEVYPNARKEIIHFINNELNHLDVAADIKKIIERNNLQDCWVFPSSGYFIAQSAQIDKKRNGYIFINFSPQKFSHGHYDASSFEYTIDNTKWIVDSGGPYRYESSFQRHYLLCSRAHNVCMPDDREQTDGESWVIDYREKKCCYKLIIGTNVHGSDYKHIRSYIILKNVRAIAITDYFQKMGKNKRLQITGYLHFDPEVLVQNDANGSIKAFNNGNILYIDHVEENGNALIWENVKGYGGDSNNMQGYVSRIKRTMEAAPTLLYKKEGYFDVGITIILAGDPESLEIIRGLKTELTPLSSFLE